MKPGPKKGYKQTPEHIAKKIRRGEHHHAWVGDNATERTGRSRAERLFPVIGPCVKCGNRKSERHHKNGNTLDNRKSNIAVLCRRCHMRSDGRLAQFKKLALKNQPKAVAARWY